MPTTDETLIQQLLDELVEAWDRGDGSRFLADATFTNVNGTFHMSCDEFNQRHEEIFRGPMKGTKMTLTPRKVRFIRPDVAIADLDCGVFDSSLQPPGVQAGADGALRTCLLMVLVKEGGSWWIAAYHNVRRSAARYDSTGRT